MVRPALHEFGGAAGCHEREGTVPTLHGHNAERVEVVARRAPLEGRPQSTEVK